MKDWQRIRLERTDLTDYVIHFTKARPTFDNRWPDRPLGHMPAEKVFYEILDEGIIRPTFAPIRSKKFGTTSNTVRGPSPAVCLTEQPLSAVLTTRRCAGDRYSGFGVAYHKFALFQAGGRPVLYGSKEMLGRRFVEGDGAYEKGKDIYSGGLPLELQYLWVRYEPTVDGWDDYPIDFMWEREWRYRCDDQGLPVHLSHYAGMFIKPEIPIGALIVENDRHLDAVQELLQAKSAQGAAWAAKLTRIISLEKVADRTNSGDLRYARIETWPE